MQAGQIILDPSAPMAAPQPASVSSVSLSRRQVAVAIADLLSRFANTRHGALERRELRKRLHGQTGVMVTESFGGDPAKIQFAFFLAGTEAKLARLVWNVETFNASPKIYTLNAIRHLTSGMSEAQQHEIDTFASRFTH